MQFSRSASYGPAVMLVYFKFIAGQTAHFERQSSPNDIQIFYDKSCDLLKTD